MPGVSKLTPKVQGILTQALGAGVFRTVAARHAGIDRSTLYAWLERGEADHEHGKATPHAKLHQAVLAAEADAELRAAALIQKAAQRDWRAAAWFLERRHQDRWGGKTRVEHSGAVSTTAPTDLSHLTDDELAEIERVLDGAAARADA